MIQFHEVEQNSPEWFELRAPLYTASEAYKLLKLGKFKKEKSNFKGNKYTRRGHLLEPEALELYHAIKGTTSLSHGFVTNTKYPNAGASPDDLTHDTYVEVKCFGEDRHIKCSINQPPEIVAQIQFGMMVTEYKKADLVLYNPDIEDNKMCLFIIEIKRNKNIHDNFKRILGE